MDYISSIHLDQTNKSYEIKGATQNSITQDGTLPVPSSVIYTSQNTQDVRIQHLETRATLLDNKTKNIAYMFPFTKTPEGTQLTYTCDGETVTVTGTVPVSSDPATTYVGYNVIRLVPGTYVLTGCPEGGSDSTYWLGINKGSTPVVKDYGDGVEFTVASTGVDYKLWYTIVNNGQSLGSGIVYRPMICLKELYDAAGPSYVQPTIAGIDYLGMGVQIGVSTDGDTIDANNLLTPGIYYAQQASLANRVLNVPNEGGWTRGFRLEVKAIVSATNSFRQEITTDNHPERIYVRTKYGTNAWSSWYVFTGTVVS